MRPHISDSDLPGRPLRGRRPSESRRGVPGQGKGARRPHRRPVVPFRANPTVSGLGLPVSPASPPNSEAPTRPPDQGAGQRPPPDQAVTPREETGIGARGAEETRQRTDLGRGLSQGRAGGRGAVSRQRRGPRSDGRIGAALASGNARVSRDGGHRVGNFLSEGPACSSSRRTGKRGEMVVFEEPGWTGWMSERRSVPTGSPVSLQSLKRKPFGPKQGQTPQTDRLRTGTCMSHKSSPGPVSKTREGLFRPNRTRANTRMRRRVKDVRRTSLKSFRRRRTPASAGETQVTATVRSPPHARPNG